jgi:hypothetical protein
MAAQTLLSVTNTPQKVQLARIAHVIQKHPDLRRWEEFAKDFGFVEAGRQGGTAYYRGFGKDPYCVVACASESGKKEFGGAAFVTKSKADFEKAKKIPGATLVDISSAPGGGQMVSIPTPTNNFIHVIWGQTEGENAQPTNTIKITHEEFNTSLEKARKRKWRPSLLPDFLLNLSHFQANFKDLSMRRRRFINWDTMDISPRSLRRTLSSIRQISTLWCLTSLPIPRARITTVSSTSI